MSTKAAIIKGKTDAATKSAAVLARSGQPENLNHEFKRDLQQRYRDRSRGRSGCSARCRRDDRQPTVRFQLVLCRGFDCPEVVLSIGSYTLVDWCHGRASRWRDDIIFIGDEGAWLHGDHGRVDGT
jgi:hypothetical protein